MIILLGGSGYVGKAFQSELSKAQLPYRVVSRTSVDYTNPKTLKDYLQQQNPSFLINSAGYTGRPNVDACEVNKPACLAGNAVLPGIIRDVCEELHLPWGHVSSGCIYTGARPDGSGFTEDDAPNFSFRQNNCSFYSGCKALGEEVLAGAESCYIWRLRIPFDNIDSPRNYISKMMRYERLLDATNSLSHLGEFTAACISCWTEKVEFGTYNLTNPGSVTASEVVDMIKRHGLSDKAFSFFRSEQEFMELATPVPRSNCVLDSSRAVRAGLPLSPVHEVLEEAVKNWIPAEGRS